MKNIFYAEILNKTGVGLNYGNPFDVCRLRGSFRAEGDCVVWQDGVNVLLCEIGRLLLSCKRRRLCIY